MRTAWFPVEFPSQDRIFYYLVYVTHHAKGIIVFLEESEKAFDYQRAVKFSVRQRQRETKSGMADLFGDALGNQARPSTTVDADLRTAWLRQLPSVGSELSVDESQMADLAEQCGCFISELQSTLRRLIEEGVVRNKSSSRSRKKNVVNYRNREVIYRQK